MPTLILPGVPPSLMRPSLSAALLLTALLLGAGCTSGPDLATYRQHGLSFDYPAGWNLSEERDPDGGYTLNLDAGGGNSLIVSTTPGLPAAFPPTGRLDTLGVWYAESRARLLSVGATVIEERQETVAGRPANRVVYTVEKDGVAYRNVLVVTAIGDTGYSFHLFALPEANNELADDLEIVLSSFRVNGVS
jgi:hypothetical protein